jgi:hypothetical protein
MKRSTAKTPKVLTGGGKIDDRPKKHRAGAGTSKFEKTPHWAELKALIDAGIPEGEYRLVGITPADRAAFGLEHPRTAPRFVAKYLEKIAATMEVSLRNIDGYEQIIVTNRPKD